MIPGTSKIWSKSGPGALLIITKMLQRNTRTIMKSSWKNIIFVNLGLTKLRKCPKSVCPRYQVFSMCVFRFLFLVIFEYIF